MGGTQSLGLAHLGHKLPIFGVAVEKELQAILQRADRPLEVAGAVELLLLQHFLAVDDAPRHRGERPPHGEHQLKVVCMHAGTSSALMH